MLDLVSRIGKLKRSFVDGEATDERPAGAMLAGDTAGIWKLVIHQHRHGAVAIIENAEAIRNSGHAPWLSHKPCRSILGSDLVAGREKRGDLHVRNRRN